MPVSVLICGSGPLSDAVHSTPLGRSDLKRHRADNAQAAVAEAARLSPRLVLIDRDLGGASELVAKLRATPPTSGASIVVVAEGDFHPREVEMLEQGANAVLRFPPGPDWETRLARLLDVPVRKQIRVKADLSFTGALGEKTVTGRIANLSRTGMLVECEMDASIGEPFAFKIEIAFDDVIEGRARLVRLAGPNQYGCEFLEIEAWAARKLDLYVQQA